MITKSLILIGCSTIVTTDAKTEHWINPADSNFKIERIRAKEPMEIISCKNIKTRFIDKSRPLRRYKQRSIE